MPAAMVRELDPDKLDWFIAEISRRGIWAVYERPPTTEERRRGETHLRLQRLGGGR
jgi:hypothetical protein